ncbi:classical arabinogalactan protein 2-like isoform X1 [Lytechinus variegatus]|uniref:classical arabinogalactan protein 2-like isoform X1 n=1 Tax=Lytechinus variegatus TaxID=7654 RepID=UPI001BB19A29|nr:classical arabinogalactan protein 2-like isoform X1 [Lytechinus variegatus]
MGLRYLIFVSSLMLFLVVTCSAQTPTEAPSDATTLNMTTPEVGPTENMTTAKEPDTAAANDSTTTKPNTEAPAPDKSSTEAPTTKAPMTDSPTESPAAGTTDKAADSGSRKGFSAGSFIGGIILAVAVLGIGFCGFKFYQSRQDKNYQTL